MAVDYVRALALQHGVKLCHHTRVVTAPPVELKERYARGQPLAEVAHGCEAADSPVHRGRVDAVHDLRQTHFHPAHGKDGHEVQDPYRTPTLATHHGLSISESPCVTNQASAESAVASDGSSSPPGSTSR